VTVIVTLGIEPRGRERNNCNPTRDMREHYNHIEYSGSDDLNERSENE